MMFRAVIAAAVILLSSPAHAKQQTGDMDPVVVSGIGNPELKSYLVMLAGLDAFEVYRSLAPTARELRFKLIPRASAPPDALQGLTLDIVSDNGSVPVPVQDDGTFTLPRNEAAYRADADLMLNKKKGHYRWQPVVRSENVPAGRRRLGDLRLECQVKVAVAKAEMGFWRKSMINMLLLSSDWCSQPKLKLTTMSERRIRAATLVSGDRRILLDVRPDGERYLAPLGDSTWPDDALVEFEFADDGITANQSVRSPIESE